MLHDRLLTENWMTALQFELFRLDVSVTATHLNLVSWEYWSDITQTFINDLIHVELCVTSYIFSLHFSYIYSFLIFQSF